MSLDGWYVTWEIIAAIGTIAVFVGVFLEYGLGVFGVLRFWGLHPAHIEVETSIKRFGSMLVVLGLAVELVGGVGVIVTSLRLDTLHRHEIAKLNRDTEQLRADTLEDERAMMDRRIDFLSMLVKTSKTPNIREGTYPDWANPTWFLGTVSDVKLVIRCVPEFEAVKFASDFAELSRRGWTKPQLQIENDLSKALEIEDGTHIYSWCPHFPDGLRHHTFDDPSKADSSRPESRAFAAATGLWVSLRASSEIDAVPVFRAVPAAGEKLRFLESPFDELPTDTVLITIGAKDMKALFNRRWERIAAAVTFSATPTATRTPTATPTATP